MNNPDSDLEKRLWSAADKLRSNIDAAEYKLVVFDRITQKCTCPCLVVIIEQILHLIMIKIIILTLIQSLEKVFLRFKDYLFYGNLQCES